MRVLAVVLLHHYPRGPRWLISAVAVVAMLFGIGSTVRLAQIGHNGAKASWGEVNMSAKSHGEGGEGDDQLAGHAS